MTWQNPIYAFLHAAADTGVANLTLSAAAESGFPEDNIIDYRQSSLFKWGTAGDQYVQIDRGTGTLEAINRIVVPAGHNLETTTTISLSASTTGAWGGEQVTLASWDQSAQSDPDGIIDQSCTSNSSRYLRFRVHNGGTKWEFGQLWLSNRRTPSIGPDPDFTEQQESNTVSVPFPSRTASLSLASNRWRWEFTYNYVDGTDLTLFDDLVEEVGIDLLPFYFWPPDDTTPTGPLLVKIAQGSYRREQARRTPSGASGAAYNISFSLIEQIA